MTKLLHVGLAISLLVVAPSCTKKGGTETPGETGGAGKAGAGLELRYALAPGKLVQTGKFDMSTTGGGQFGEAKLQFTANLELAPQGDKLKVVWSFADVGQLDLQGMFAGKDAAAEDPKALLVSEGKGAFLVDARGQLDEGASEKLAENAARRQRFAELQKAAASGKAAPPGGAAQLLALADAMIALPDLPEQGLEVGKPITISEEEQTELGGSGIVLPTEKETKYTLVKIDESGGKRIAEIAVDGVSSGATEMQGSMLTVDITNEGTMLFDLDAKLPVSYRFTRTQAFSAGQVTIESTMMLEASFAAG